jgi:hypothetical protein
MTDSTPYYINELRSDLRGVKEGWYAIDEGGNLLFGPFSDRKTCLTRITFANFADDSAMSRSAKHHRT